MHTFANLAGMFMAGMFDPLRWITVITIMWMALGTNNPLVPYSYRIIPIVVASVVASAIVEIVLLNTQLTREVNPSHVFGMMLITLLPAWFVSRFFKVKPPTPVD